MYSQIDHSICIMYSRACIHRLVFNMRLPMRNPSPYSRINCGDFTSMGGYDRGIRRIKGGFVGIAWRRLRRQR